MTVVNNPFEENLFGQRRTDNSLIAASLKALTARVAVLEAEEAWTKVQYASVVATTNAAGQFVITFPVAFTVAPSVVLMTNGDRNQGFFWCSVVGGSVTTTQFTGQFENQTGAIALTTLRINYVAIQ